MIPYPNIQEQIDILKEDSRHSHLIAQLVDDPRMDHVWKQMEKAALDLTDLCFAIHDALEWPDCVTDRMTSTELSKWNDEVRELALTLAEKIRTSRLDFHLASRHSVWCEREIFIKYHPDSTYKAPSEPLRYHPDRNFTYKQMLFLLFNRPSPPLMSDLLTEFAELKEWEVESVDAPQLLVLAEPRREGARREILAYNLTEWARRVTGQPKRRIVGIITAVVLGGKVPSEGSIRRWARKWQPGNTANPLIDDIVNGGWVESYLENCQPRS